MLIDGERGQLDSDPRPAPLEGARALSASREEIELARSIGPSTPSSSATDHCARVASVRGRRAHDGDSYKSCAQSAATIERAPESPAFIALCLDLIFVYTVLLLVSDRFNILRCRQNCRENAVMRIMARTIYAIPTLRDIYREIEGIHS